MSRAPMRSLFEKLGRRLMPGSLRTKSLDKAAEGVVAAGAGELDSEIVEDPEVAREPTGESPMWRKFQSRPRPLPLLRLLPHGLLPHRSGQTH